MAQYLCLAENDNGAGVAISGHDGKNNVNFLGVVRSLRSNPPTDFILKIKSFSSLSATLAKSPLKKYDSGIFEAGGYKWKLSIYPNGRKDEMGEGYISIYLVLADANNLPRGFVVNVIFKLFVYDHSLGKYLIAQDGAGMVRQFDTMNTQWGYPQFLPKSVFCYGLNGLLVDDSCVFGAEVLVLEDKTTKVECLSMIEENNCSWKIDNFSKINEPFCQSQVFNVAGSKWRLSIYYPRRGNNKQELEKKHLGVYLEWIGEFDTTSTTFSKLTRWFRSSNSETKDKQMVQVTLRVRDQLSEQHKEIIGPMEFEARNMQMGEDQFMLLSELNDPSTGYLVDDSMIVEASFPPTFLC